MLLDEKVFKSKKDIKYLFYPNKESKYLAIIFSSYAVSKTIKAAYNYIESLKNIKINKLFILDDYGYDGRGCWYLGENLDFSVEYSVNELIRYIQNENNIQSENIIACGSSKGGFAATYYGIKYRYGHIIVAAPQILLYNYICHFENILKAMESKEYDTVNILNNLILDLDICEYTKFHIYCGISDGHLKQHVIPLVKKILKENNNKIYLELINGNHSDIGIFFKEKICEDINSIVDDDVLYSDRLEIEMLLKQYDI